MYVYENYGKMDYSIKCRLSLDINNLAKIVAKETNNGTYGTAKALSMHQLKNDFKQQYGLL